VIAVEEPIQIQRKPTPIEKEMVFDYLKYAPANLKIQTLEGNLISFSFNEIQLLLDEIAHDLEALTGMVRLVILKARREGVTTYWAGKFYHNTSHNRNRYSYIITHEPDATDFVFKMVKRFYDHCTWKPATKYNNTTLLEFNKPSGIGGLDSAFRVATANKKDIGSAQLIHNLLLSEIAKYGADAAEDILTSLLPTVPSEPNTYIIMESTAKGVGGKFYDRFVGARYIYEMYLDHGQVKWRRSINPLADANNIYARIFIPCFVFKKYQADPDPGFKRTTTDHETYGNEQNLVDLYGVNDCFLQWRRNTIINVCDNSLRKFLQEFPCSWQEAFLSSGHPVFNVVKCQEKITKCVPPRAVYDCILETGQFTAKTLGPADDANNLLQVWTEAQPGVPYIISADVSEGKEVGKSGKETDYHAADVAEQLTGKQVAHWHGKVEPVDFAVWLYHMGLRYNMAWLVPERNNHGTAVVGELARRKYKKLYFEESLNPPHRPILRYGWATVGGKYGDAKSLVIDNLSNLVNKDADGIVCADTLREMITYKQGKTGKLGAEEGCFDDRVMSWAINCWVRGRLKLPSATPGAAETQGPAMSGKGMF
jgi:hypothetical protein